MSSCRGREVPAPLGQRVYCFFSVDRVAVNTRAAEVTKGGTVVQLTAREFQLLTYCIEHRGATLSRDELLDAVWGYNSATPILWTRRPGRLLSL